MKPLLHKAPSAGSIIKKIVTINPDLGTQDVIQIIKLSTELQSQAAGDFEGTEVINEAKALHLAQATLKKDF